MAAGISVASWNSAVLRSWLGRMPRSLSRRVSLAVLIGRPYVYGLAVDGQRGVTRVINILRRELESAMALCGRTSIASIDASVIWR